VLLAKDVDAAVRAVAAVLVKVDGVKAGDDVVRAGDAARAKVGDDAVRAADAAPAKVDGDHAKVGAARARAEEAHARADADRGEASRHVIRRLLRSRVPTVPGVPTSGTVV
jgi:hypothetical protein